MKSQFRRVGARLIGVTALALLPLFGATIAAHADTQTVTYDIQSTAAGQTVDSTLSVGVDTTAPATVAPGGSVTDVLAPQPVTVPTSAGGHPINQIQNIALKLPVPANSTFVSATLSGGAGLGSAAPTVAESGNVITVTVPGPIAGGATFTLPTLTLGLTAGGSGTIQTQLAGTSFSDPGLTFTAVTSVLGFPVNAPTVGFPNPNPVLATTTIG
jgi:dehydratase